MKKILIIAGLALISCKKNSPACTLATQQYNEKMTNISQAETQAEIANASQGLQTVVDNYNYQCN